MESIFRLPSLMHLVHYLRVLFPVCCIYWRYTNIYISLLWSGMSWRYDLSIIDSYGNTYESETIDQTSNQIFGSFTWLFHIYCSIWSYPICCSRRSQEYDSWWFTISIWLKDAYYFGEKFFLICPVPLYPVFPRSVLAFVLTTLETLVIPDKFQWLCVIAEPATV